MVRVYLYLYIDMILNINAVIHSFCLLVLYKEAKGRHDHPTILNY